MFSEYAQSRSGNAGSTAAFRLELPIGQFAISSGLEMSNYGKQYNFTYVNPEFSEDVGTPTINVTRFDYTYLSIPLRVKYNWRMVYAQVGVKAEMFRKGAVIEEGTMSDATYLSKPVLTIDDIRKNNITTEFAFGVNFLMPNRPNVGLYFEPNVSYMTKSIYNNLSLENNQLSYGLKVGAKYTFTNLRKSK